MIVLLQHDWPQGENLFLKAVDKICQQGSFQYENFFNYVTSILRVVIYAYRFYILILIDKLLKINLTYKIIVRMFIENFMSVLSLTSFLH